MSRTLYVGNLPLSTTAEALAVKFGICGTVVSVKIVTDEETGRLKGIAFVEMANSSEAQTAIDKLNLSNYDGRLMSVNKLRAAAVS